MSWKYVYINIMDVFMTKLSQNSSHLRFSNNIKQILPQSSIHWDLNHDLAGIK